MPTSSPAESPETPKPKQSSKPQAARPIPAVSATTKVEKKPAAVAQPNINGERLASAGLALSIASIFTNVFTFGILAIVSLVLSIMGRIQTKKTGAPSGLALAGIIISGIVMFLSFMGFIMLVVFAMLSGGNYGIDCNSVRFSDHEFCQSIYEEAPRRDTPGRDLFEPNGM